MKSDLKRHIFQIAIVLCGVAALTVSGLRLDVTVLDLRFLVLTLATILGARVSVQIPAVRGKISVSDTLIFLAAILCGKEAAVMLATIDGICSSFRFARKTQTILFNAAVMATSTFLAVWAVELAVKHPWSGLSPNFFIGLSILALVQYGANSGLVAILVAIRSGRRLWQSWREDFLWASLTYFAGAFAAGFVYRLILTVGFLGFLATTPIIVIVYFTYATYLRNVEVSAKQAKQAEQFAAAMQESEGRFRSAFEHAAGMALVNREGDWVRVNKSLCKMLGYTEAELLATSLSSITHPNDASWLTEQLANLVAGSIATIELEQRCRRRDGEYIWVSLSVTKITETQGASDLILQVQDITDRKRAEEQLRYDAFHDALTGLPNRALFMDHLSQSLIRWKRKKQNAFAVLFLDLDRFKNINDTLGHLEGDQLLVEISRRLKATVRPGDTVARLGGDEFTVLLDDLNDSEEVLTIVKRLTSRLEEPLKLGDHELLVTASIGIAGSADYYEQPEELLRDADAAMYRAKHLGKARYEVFDRAMTEKLHTQLQIETDLRQAVQREELSLEYQPIVELATGKIAGFEALLRWQHASLGMIPPPEFISVAEETGTIAPIGEWVLAQACRQVREWQKLLPQDPPLYVSVNLSVKQLSEPHLVDQVALALEKSGLGPENLKLEITESMIMNADSAPQVLAQLQALGVDISIDDFGTGYSSLSYLHRVPASMLKIDRSFVNSMSNNHESCEIVSTIVKLAQSLKLKTVAEGIETEDQLDKLRALNCDYGQGHFFSKSLRPDWAASLLFASSSQYLPKTRDNIVDYESSSVA